MCCTDALSQTTSLSPEEDLMRPFCIGQSFILENNIKNFRKPPRPEPEKERHITPSEA